MNRLQFWEWGLWPWLGDVIASQPFLTLMVPVATLTGVVITTKSNERIRRRELQGEGERWRYEVGRILVVVETLLMFRLSLSVRPFSRLVFESPGFCGGGG